MAVCKQCYGAGTIESREMSPCHVCGGTGLKEDKPCEHCSRSGLEGSIKRIPCSYCSASIAYSEGGGIKSLKVSGSDHLEVEAVAKSFAQDTTDALELKHAELKAKYHLAKIGIIKGGVITVAAIGTALTIFKGALDAFLVTWDIK